MLVWSPTSHFPVRHSTCKSFPSLTALDTAALHMRAHMLMSARICCSTEADRALVSMVLCSPARALVQAQIASTQSVALLSPGSDMCRCTTLELSRFTPILCCTCKPQGSPRPCLSTASVQVPTACKSNGHRLWTLDSFGSFSSVSLSLCQLCCIYSFSLCLHRVFVLSSPII